MYTHLKTYTVYINLFVCVVYLWDKIFNQKSPPALTAPTHRDSQYTSCFGATATFSSLMQLLTPTRLNCLHQV